VSVENTECPLKSLATPIIHDISTEKKEEMSSLLSISNDLPQPKKKILLSMEVITEEKIKETGDSFNSSNHKDDVQIHKFIDSEESPICPVSSQVQCQELNQVLSKKETAQPPKKCKKGTLVPNKKKKGTNSKNENKKKHDAFTTSISLKNIGTQNKNDIEKVNHKSQSRCRKKGSKANIKESEYALSFSSGTNLTQTSFDFGFSKVTSCECSLVSKAGVGNQCIFNKKQSKQTNSKNPSLNNLENTKDNNNKNKKRNTKSKKKSKKNSQATKKCCNCGQKSTKSLKKNTNLEIPNFIVQPFNKYQTILKPRNYDLDQRGTLGNPFTR
jgi:hypothetical protein